MSEAFEKKKLGKKSLEKQYGGKKSVGEKKVEKMLRKKFFFFFNFISLWGPWGKKVEKKI